MPSTDISEVATCTSCTFDEDFSNYWTANVYYKSPKNGTYKRVPIMVNDAIGAANGGMTVYYSSPGKGQTTAFKPVRRASNIFHGSRLTYHAQGFRMFSGEANRRTPTKLGRQTQSCFRCYDGPNFQGNIYSPCFDNVRDTEGFPSKPCPGGWRSSVIFPM